MEVKFDTSNPKDIAEAAELIEGLKKLAIAKPSNTAQLVFDTAQRAFIMVGKELKLFGEYEKGAKENWYKAICALDKQGETFATPEACIKWLTDKYNEHVLLIFKK